MARFQVRQPMRRYRVQLRQLETGVKKNPPEITSPLKAIRAYCMDCMGDIPERIAECEKTDCSLHPCRFGTNPHHKRSLSDDEKKERVARLGTRRKNAPRDEC